MPSYRFTDQENKVLELVKDGDYILEVVKCEFGVTKQAGDDKMELTVAAEGTNAVFYETLTFTQKTAWKVDTFVKSCNLLIDGKKPALDQDIEFSEPMVVGLRGWATVGRDEYPDKSGKWRNKVRVWLTNKPKLPKRVVEAETEAQGEDDPKWT